jgi:uncharacterized protein YdaU (DUF1376 family)
MERADRAPAPVMGIAAMSNPPWMPLNIADYLRDTTHLEAEASGAYLHLIMGYWVAGKLPDDDRQLARIAKLPLAKFKRLRPILEAFFRPNFSSHKRIDLELQRAAQIKEFRSDRARQAANQRWHKHAPSNAMSNAMSIRQAMLGDAHTQRKKDLTDLEIEVGAVDNSGQAGKKRSAEEAVQRMRSRKTGAP